MKNDKRHTGIESDLIDLARRYQSVPVDREDLEKISADSAVASMFGRDEGFSLDELLDNPLVVVLGEARSGKTTEFRLGVDRSIAQGRFAFFIRIEDLAHLSASDIDSIAICIERPDVGVFYDWLASEAEASFFLDAVDEAKLNNVGDYRRAINILRVGLRDHLKRMRLLISCRVTEWRPKDDVEPLNAIKPLLAKASSENLEDESNKSIKLVQICPLDVTRIGHLARYFGLGNPEEFIRGIRAADALEYAGRPGDIRELIEIWKRDGRLGTLTALTEQNVLRKLGEDAEPYDSAISSDEARDGAERLAAASVMCREPSFRYAPTEQDPVGALPGLNPTEILSEWQPEKVQALLRRAIFDEATYGRVRFHTRSVREYLAASWFRKRYERGCPEAEIIQVFFVERYGKVSAIPSLTAIIAWLAPYIPGLLEAALKHNPEILPDEGDPQALPLTARTQVLKALVERYRNRKRTGYRFSEAGLHRFSHPDLAPTIRTLLCESGAPADVKQLLLDLVRIGRLEGCRDQCLSIALDESEDSATRVDAVLALRAMTATQELRSIHREMRGKAVVASRFFSWVVYSLYPEIISASEVMDLIEACPVGTEEARSHVQDIIPRAIENEERPEELGVLIQRIYPLLVSENFDVREDYAVSSWLYRSFCIAVLKTLKVLNESPDWLVDALYLIAKSHSHDHRAEEVIKEIGERYQKASMSIRQKLFWKTYSWYQSRNEQVRAFMLMGHHDWRLVPEDFDWLIADIKSMKEPLRRFTAVDAAIAVASNGLGGFDSEKIKELASAASDDASLLEYIDRCQAPREKQSWEYRHELRQAARILRERDQEIKLKELVVSSIHILDKPEGGNLLCQVLDSISGTFDEEPRLMLKAAQDKFGIVAARAFVSGVKQFWRTWETERGNYRMGDRVALLGAKFDFADGLSAESLTDDLALRLAHLSLNDFSRPPWLERLFLFHQKAILDVYLPIIVEELGQSYGASSVPSVTSMVSYASQEMRSVFADQIFDVVKRRMPLSVGARSSVIRVLSATSDRAYVRAICQDYLCSKSDISIDDIYWAAAWIKVDGAAALSWLEPQIEALPFEDRFALVEGICAALDSRHSAEIFVTAEAEVDTVSALTTLIRIAYGYVRPQDDVRHYGVYSPTSRDAAQSFRDGLFGRVASIKGEEAYRALLNLADLYNGHGERDWILRLAEQKIGRDADVPWSEGDISNFSQLYERDAKTGDDLFYLAVKRLLEIKNKTETGDYSIRDIFNEKIDESLLQKYLAERLQELSRGRYSVVREAEVDDDKEPDIRVLHRDLPPVSIEIKWAHKWTLSQLELALSQQLVGQYLKAVNSTHGILLLANAADGKVWGKRSGPRFGFKELVAHLSDQARVIEATVPGVSRLKVIGIQF